MNRKLKLAKLIMIESEALKGINNISNSIELAEEITRDAIELAKMVEMEEMEKEIA